MEPSSPSECTVCNNVSQKYNVCSICSNMVCKDCCVLYTTDGSILCLYCGAVTNRSPLKSPGGSASSYDMVDNTSINGSPLSSKNPSEIEHIPLLTTISKNFEHRKADRKGDIYVDQSNQPYVRQSGIGNFLVADENLPEFSYMENQPFLSNSSNPSQFSPKYLRSFFASFTEVKPHSTNDQPDLFNEKADKHPTVCCFPCLF